MCDPSLPSLEMLKRLGAPSFAHFRPKDKFVEWLKDYSQDQRVVELGAGALSFSAILHKEGLPVIAVEPRADLTQGLNPFHVMPMLAQQAVQVLPGELYIAARPDHSGWVSDTIYYMSEGSRFLYVGLEKNLECDLPEDEFNRELVYEEAGEEGEKAWKINLKQ